MRCRGTARTPVSAAEARARCGRTPRAPTGRPPACARGLRSRPRRRTGRRRPTAHESSRRPGGIGNVVGVVDDPPVALERVERPVAGARRRRAALPACGSCSSARSRRAASAATTGPARRRSSTAASVSVTRATWIRPPSSGGASGAARSRAGVVRSAARRSRARTTSTDVVERGAAAVVVGRAARPPARRSRRSSRSRSSAVSRSMPTTAATGLPVSGDDHLAAVGGVGHETGDAPAAGRGDAQVLELGASAMRPTVQNSAQTLPGTLTGGSACRILPPR